MIVLKAASHVQRSYDNVHLLPATHKIDTGKVRAYCLVDKTVVVPGTDQTSDWFDFNLKTKAVPWDIRPEAHAGASGTLWHEGFLDHARIVYKFAREVGARSLVGHSLGGASAQIVGASLNLPVVAFAAPPVKLRKSPFPGEHRVMNIMRSDDPVPNSWLLNAVGFRHLGKKYELRVQKQRGLFHSMDHYISLMKLPQVSAFLPASWPL